ncbi:hypothetical protein EES46_00775 [Streptomyces sp. ADI98-10]|nr:hypothetical protein EES46_00775 [Streptomyces sp. ADI98-10]
MEKRWATSSCPGSGGPVFRPWSARCPSYLTCGRAVVVGRCWALLVTRGGPTEGPAVLPLLPSREEEQSPSIHRRDRSVGMSRKSQLRSRLWSPPHTRLRTWPLADLFVPKQLVRTPDLGPLRLLPARVVRRCPCSSAAVSRHGHAVRHSLLNGCGTNLSRRQSATTADATTDRARVCIAAPHRPRACYWCRRSEHLTTVGTGWQCLSPQLGSLGDLVGLYTLTCGEATSLGGRVKGAGPYTGVMSGMAICGVTSDLKPEPSGPPKSPASG